MAQGPSLILVPVFNEAISIGRVLPKLCDVSGKLKADILVVDDGSTDGGLDGLKDSCIHVLRHETNQGYGGALISGFRFASQNGYAKLITLDCDEQHQPEYIQPFLEQIGDLDVLSGSRYLPDSKRFGVRPAPDRVEINQFITQRINSLTGFRLSDSFCGMKAYRVAALENIALREQGYAMPLEFWLRASAAGLKVGELAVPLIYQARKRSFGEKLDDPSIRLKYYDKVMTETLADLK